MNDIYFMSFYLNLIFFMVYFLLHIGIFYIFKNPSMKYFSFIFQFIIFVEIISNQDSYIPMISFVYDLLLILILMIFSGIELKNNRMV